MSQYQYAQMIFDAAIAAHSTACAISRAARRAGASADVRAANRDRRRAAHDAVRAAYDVLRATYS